MDPLKTFAERSSGKKFIADGLPKPVWICALIVWIVLALGLLLAAPVLLDLMDEDLGCMEVLLHLQELSGIRLATAIYVDEMPRSSFNGRAFAAAQSGGAFCMLDHGMFRLLHHLSLGVFLPTNSRDICPQTQLGRGM